MPGGPSAVDGHVLGASGSKSKFAGIAMTTFSAFGGILFGYDTGVIAGIKEMKAWLRQFGYASDNLALHATGYAISSSSESLVVSILSAGTFFGALTAAPVAGMSFTLPGFLSVVTWLTKLSGLDILGRKWGIIFACLVFSVGVAMQTAATALPLFVVGRVFAGLGVGLVSCLIPMYQSECSPKWIRGAVVATYQWAITIGLFISAVVNNGTKDRDNSSAYVIPIALQFAWALILAGGMILLPESPRWLIKRGRENDAAVALSRLIGAPVESAEVESELDEIRANLEDEKALGDSTYSDCFKSGKNQIALRTLTGIFIQAWQQLTGINFIFYYGTTFFKNSGIRNPFVITIITNVVNVVMTLPGMWGIERFGRRRLLLVGAVGMAFCEYLVAIIGVTISTENIAGQKVLIAFICFYIAFFAATWGPIAWVITGEIFPLQIRAKAMSLSIASNWLWNFGIGYATPYLVNKAAGSAGLEVKVFFIWGTTCTCCLIFTYFCIPETKGLSLEQIDLMYQHTSPRLSLDYRRRLIAEGGLSNHPSEKRADIDYIPQSGKV